MRSLQLKSGEKCTGGKSVSPRVTYTLHFKIAYFPTLEHNILFYFSPNCQLRDIRRRKTETFTQLSPFNYIQYLKSTPLSFHKAGSFHTDIPV